MKQEFADLPIVSSHAAPVPLGWARGTLEEAR